MDRSTKADWYFPSKRTPMAAPGTKPGSNAQPKVNPLRTPARTLPLAETTTEPAPKRAMDGKLGILVK
jgi:hypothetical protein